MYLAIVAFLFVLLYLLLVRKRPSSGGGWERIRARQRERLRNPPPEQPIDTNFVFDPPPVLGQEPLERDLR